MMLDAIRAPARGCAVISAMLDEDGRHVAKTLAELRGMRWQLKHRAFLRTDPSWVWRCDIVNAISRASRDTGASGSAAHVRGSQRRRYT